MQCALVGLPNVGKSTLFNALTSAGAEAQNFPFCTIEPNTGVVQVPDPRLERISEIVRPERTIPTSVEFIDIAGLVSGASQGDGLGNQFLSHIRQAHAIAQVVRCFQDDSIVHVNGRAAPSDDVDIINTELMLADLQTCEKARDGLQRQARSGIAESREALALIERLCGHLEAGRPVRTLELDEAAQRRIREYHLLSAKPMLYIANIQDERADAGYVEQLCSCVQGAEVVAVNSLLEAEIAELEPDERGEFLLEAGLDEPGLNRVIRAGYALLNLQTFFTAGPKECRAWTFTTGAPAPSAAGRIHSDFERGFIRAEVIGYEDFIRCGGEAGAREAGRLRQEGKEYTVQDGDVIHFRFNV
ncbi:MAG: redox-regulated ATPase YchF [Gammaproteobacteria bacterium AqS3]|nr:redox-regulated ATPase YchF [Gammaproteobacteria bacterium AqS3]